MMRVKRRLNWIILAIGIMSFGPLHASECSLSDLSGCDSYYQKGQYELLVNAFNYTDLATTTNARLSRYYYLGLGYFGLFKNERSAAMRCFYLDQAKVLRFKFARDVIKQFGETSDFGLEQAQTKILFMRNISRQMDNARGCLEAPYSEARVDYMILQKVRHEIDQYAFFRVNPEINPLRQLSEIIKNFMTLTSNSMNKTASFDIELEGLAYTLRGIQLKLDQWQRQDSNESLDIQALKSRNQQWLTILDSIDVASLQVDLEAKEKNNGTAATLIKASYYATLYTDLFNPMRTPTYKQFKRSLQNIKDNLASTTGNNELNAFFSRLKQNVYERDKPLHPNDLCDDQGIKKWYCP